MGMCLDLLAKRRGRRALWRKVARRIQSGMQSVFVEGTQVEVEVPGADYTVATAGVSTKAGLARDSHRAGERPTEWHCKDLLPGH